MSYVSSGTSVKSSPGEVVLNDTDMFCIQVNVMRRHGYDCCFLVIFFFFFFGEMPCNGTGDLI